MFFLRHKFANLNQIRLINKVKQDSMESRHAIANFEESFQKNHKFWRIFFVSLINSINKRVQWYLIRAVHHNTIKNHFFVVCHWSASHSLHSQPQGLKKEDENWNRGISLAFCIQARLLSLKASTRQPSNSNCKSCNCTYCRFMSQKPGLLAAVLVTCKASGLNRFTYITNIRYYILLYF